MRRVLNNMHKNEMFYVSLYNLIALNPSSKSLNNLKKHLKNVKCTLTLKLSSLLFTVSRKVCTRTIVRSKHVINLVTKVCAQNTCYNISSRRKIAFKITINFNNRESKRYFKTKNITKTTIIRNGRQE